MDDPTDLDRAHAAMIAAPDDARARLAYYHRLADTELILMLQSEPRGDQIDPAIFALDQGRFVLAFDTEERLAAFSDAPVPYAALPGRVIVASLATQQVGMGLNLGVAPSAFLMPAAALDWLADALSRTPVIGAGRPKTYFPPSITGLGRAIADKLAGLGTLATTGWLAGAEHGDGRTGHVVVVQDASPAAEAALAKAVGEAILFSTADPAGIELLFLTTAQIAAEGLTRVAEPIEISLPAKAATVRPPPAAPGSDPAKPPILR